MPKKNSNFASNAVFAKKDYPNFISNAINAKKELKFCFKLHRSSTIKYVQIPDFIIHIFVGANLTTQLYITCYYGRVKECIYYNGGAEGVGRHVKGLPGFF